VADHGGTIALLSTPGAGATFEVRLPRAPETAAPAVAVAPPLPNAGVRRLLVVDDEEGVRRMAAHALRDAGYDVEVAASADDAAGAIAAGGPPVPDEPAGEPPVAPAAPGWLTTLLVSGAFPPHASAAIANTPKIEGLRATRMSVRIQPRRRAPVRQVVAPARAPRKSKEKVFFETLRVQRGLQASAHDDLAGKVPP
jgi:CheY-like chemotaxis protein